MVERARLESWYRGNSIEGSNPFLSAITESLRLVSGFFMRISQNRFLLSDNLTEINLTQSDLVHPFDLPSNFFQNVY